MVIAGQELSEKVTFQCLGGERRNKGTVRAAKLTTHPKILRYKRLLLRRMTNRSPIHIWFCGGCSRANDPLSMKAVSSTNGCSTIRFKFGDSVLRRK